MTTNNARRGVSGHTQKRNPSKRINIVLNSIPTNLSLSIMTWNKHHLLDLFGERGPSC